MDTVLVALAITGESPAASSAGKVISVPPPATELIAPAENAARKSTASRNKSLMAAFEDCCPHGL